ncbi:MAG: hypothetical protein ACXVIJ_11005, partial [Thermoanaerobaculia bacterium]
SSRLRMTSLPRVSCLVPILIAALACKPVKMPPRLAAPEPKIRATVVTIRTTVDPAKKTFVHSLVIAGNRARSGDEVDAWRLFDLDKQQVTYVNDVKKTYRTESLSELLDTRAEAMAQPLAPEIPTAQFAVTGAKRVINGIETSQAVIRSGGYVRELWIGSHPQIPPGLFAMMNASVPPSTPIAPMMKQADAALTSIQGFPLVDRSELPMGDKRLVVEHSVIKVEQRDIPASWLNVRSSYKDETVKAPAEHRPSSSSPPSGQTTPTTGSQSSATTRTTP